MKKIIKSLALALGLFLASLTQGVQALASTTPDFPACSNPKGSLIVSYDQGEHGIVGNTQTYSGADQVYQIDDVNLMQCFCAEDGSGVQTNWWKISSLSQEEINILKNSGWFFVPDGSLWGLAASAYMAKNENYSCKSGSSSGGSSGGSGGSGSGGEAPKCGAEKPEAPRLLSVVRNGSQATVTWSKVDLATHYTIAYGTQVGNYPYGVPNTGNVTTYTIGSLDPAKQYYFIVYAVNDCMPSDPSGSGVQSGRGQVLGLATTGNYAEILLFAGLGIVSLSSGLLLNKKQG